jgi:hypothetical protein
VLGSRIDRSVEAVGEKVTWTNGRTRVRIPGIIEEEKEVEIVDCMI